MRVDTQRCLVLDEMTRRMVMAVVHFRFWGDANVVVRLTQELLACKTDVAGVREDPWDSGLIEEAEAVDFFGGV